MLAYCWLPGPSCQCVHIQLLRLPPELEYDSGEEIRLERELVSVKCVDLIPLQQFFCRPIVL